MCVDGQTELVFDGCRFEAVWLHYGVCWYSDITAGDEMMTTNLWSGCVLAIYLSISRNSQFILPRGADLTKAAATVAGT